MGTLTIICEECAEEFEDYTSFKEHKKLHLYETT